LAYLAAYYENSAFDGKRAALIITPEIIGHSFYCRRRIVMFWKPFDIGVIEVQKTGES
jgi:hypothetical protein